jgi:hypothetical protein
MLEAEIMVPLAKVNLDAALSHAFQGLEHTAPVPPMKRAPGVNKIENIAEQKQRLRHIRLEAIECAHEQARPGIVGSPHVNITDDGKPGNFAQGNARKSGRVEAGAC